MNSQDAPSAQLLLEHGRWIRAFARRLVSPEDADDLVQETWMAAVQAGEAEISSRSWLATVARRLASRKHRDDRHRQDRETRAAQALTIGGGQVAKTPTPEELVERGETQRQVVDIVLGLSEPNRSALLLRYYEGLTPKEIAERLGVEAGAVRTRLSRGAAQVRDRLDELSDGDRSRWMSALVPLAAPVVLPFPDSPAPVSTGSTASAPEVGAAALSTAGLGMGVPGSLWLLIAAVALVAVGALALLQQRGATEPPLVQLVEVASTGAAEASAPESILPAGTARIAASGARVTAPAPATPLGGEATHGTIRLIDGRTSMPAAHVRFSVPGDDQRGEFSESTQVWETDAAGEALIPIDTERVVLRHSFDSSRRALGHFSPNAWPVLPDPVAVPWVDGVAQIEVSPGHRVNLDFGGADVDQSSLFAIWTHNEKRTTWGGRYSDVRCVGSQSFVRFPQVEGGTRGSWLHFVTEDGLLGASHAVHEYVDTGDVLHVQLTHRGLLRGTLVSDTPGEVQEARLLEANVMLFRGTVSADDISLPYMENVDELRRLPRSSPRAFGFAGLEPGDYTLCVHARGFEPVWLPRTVAAGDVAPLPVTMHWLNEPTATLRGVVTSQSGTYSGPLVAFVRDELIYMPTRELNVAITWSTSEGESVGSLELPDLPVHPYRVTLMGGRLNGQLNRLPHLIPGEALHAVPGDPLAIELTDSVSTSAVAFEVVDAVTGDPVEWFDLTALPTTGDPDERSAGMLGVDGAEGIAAFPSMVTGREYELSTLAVGYMMETMTFTAGSGTDPLRVELHPGWVGWPYCVDASGDPVQGVEVHCDGTLAGVTDEYGGLVLNLATAPTRVEFLLAGETPDSNDFLDDEGLLKGEIARGNRMLNATFERP